MKLDGTSTPPVTVCITALESLGYAYYPLAYGYQTASFCHYLYSIPSTQAVVDFGSAPVTACVGL